MTYLSRNKMMRKRLTRKLAHTGIFATIMGFSMFGVQAGPNPMVDYLVNSGMPPAATSQQCGSICVNAPCAGDIINKTYSCFKNCSQHTSVTISNCANRQFQGYLNDLQQQLKSLLQQNASQGQQIASLNSQLTNAQQTINSLLGDIEGLRSKNALIAQELEGAKARVTQLSGQIADLMNQNAQLTQQLQDANNKVMFHGTNTTALQEKLRANEAEIKRLNQELENMGALLTQIMKDYSEVVDKYHLLGTFLTTAADKVQQAERDMQTIAHEFAAALQKDRAATDVWVRENGQRLAQIQKNYAERTKRYNDFITQAMTLLTEQRGDVTAQINDLLESYNK